MHISWRMSVASPCMSHRVYRTATDNSLPSVWRLYATDEHLPTPCVAPTGIVVYHVASADAHHSWHMVYRVTSECVHNAASSVAEQARYDGHGGMQR